MCAFVADSVRVRFPWLTRESWRLCGADGSLLSPFFTTRKAEAPFVQSFGEKEDTLPTRAFGFLL